MNEENNLNVKEMFLYNKIYELENIKVTIQRQFNRVFWV